MVYPEIFWEASRWFGTLQNSGHTQTECQWIVRKARILSNITMYLTQPIVWAYTVPTPWLSQPDRPPLLISVCFNPTIHYYKANVPSDTSFWEGLSVTGLIPKASRGVISGHATGFPSAYADFMSVGFSNSEAEYWYVDSYSWFSCWSYRFEGYVPTPQERSLPLGWSLEPTPWLVRRTFSTHNKQPELWNDSLQNGIGCCKPISHRNCKCRHQC